MKEKRVSCHTCPFSAHCQAPKKHFSKSVWGLSAKNVDCPVWKNIEKQTGEAK